MPELKELISAWHQSKDAEVCFVAPLGEDATTTALELGLDPTRTVGVDPLFGFAKRRTLMATRSRARTCATPRTPCSPPTACRSR